MNPDFSYKEIIDLSMPMKSLDTPVYPGYPQPLKATLTTIRENGYASSLWIFAEHSSTHVDSPAHFFGDLSSIDKVPISRYIGPGVVLDFSKRPARYKISKDDIARALGQRDNQKGSILLFYTGYTEKARTPEWMNHPELTDDACRYVVQLQANAIGFDAPSPDHEPFPAHKILLPKTISIFENLANLDKILNKSFVFFGVPMSLAGGTASPVRAFAMIL